MGNILYLPGVKPQKLRRKENKVSAHLRGLPLRAETGKLNGFAYVAFTSHEELAGVENIARPCRDRGSRRSP